MFSLPKLFRDLDLERTPIGESAGGDQGFVAAALLHDIVAYGFQKEGGRTDQQRRQGGELSNGQYVIGDRSLQLGPAHEPHRNRTGSMQNDFSSVRIVEAAPEREPFD